MTTRATIQYNSSPTSITFTLAGMSNNVGQCSAAVDNTIDQAVDALVHLKLMNGTGTAGSIDIYAYGSADGTNFTGAAPGTNTTYTPTTAQILQLRKIDSIAAPASGLVYNNIFSMVGIFGFMPRKWGLVVVNNGTGAVLNATSTNFLCQYSTVNYISG